MSATTYYYTARTGEGRRTFGSLRAGSREAACEHLHRRSLFVTGLERAEGVRGWWTWAEVALRRNSAARPGFFRAFATLVGAGVPIGDALRVLIAQGGSFTETLEAVAADVEGGSALSGAMGAHPGEFSQICVAVVAAGEAGGTLDDGLALLADLEERDRRLRKRVTAALAYPAIVALASAGLLAFLLANTVPAFAATFSSLHVALPPVTRLLLQAGTELRRPLPWLVLAGVAVVVAGVARRWKASDAPWAMVLDRLIRAVPLIGSIATKATISRFARTFGSLCAAGVDVVAALEAASGVAEGPVNRRAMAAIGIALGRGEALAQAFTSAGTFDPVFLQLVRAGEESGRIDAMLLRLADHYDVDVESAIATLTTVLEPLLICALGAAIGTIVASIIIPLYSMIGDVQ